MSVHAGIRAAFRTALLAAERARVTGTLAVSAPDLVTGADFRTLIPGEEVTLIGFGSARRGVVLEPTATDVRVRLGTPFSVNVAGGAGRSVAAACPETVAWEGIVSSPPADRPYWRDRLAPQTAAPRTIGPRRQVRHEGLYLLDVFGPIAFGTAALDHWADYLMLTILHAGRELTDTGYRVTVRTAERGPAQYDAHFAMVPCTVAWWAHTFTP